MIATKLTWARVPLLVLASSCHTPSVRPELAIIHVAVVDVENATVAPNQTLLISDRRITAIGPAERIGFPAETGVIDAHGKWAIPGLWDMHVHLDSAALEIFLAHGITGIRDMGGPGSELIALRRALATGSVSGPRLVIAGPVLAGGSVTPRPSRVVVNTEPQGIRAVDSLAALGVDFIKVHDGIPRAAYFAIARESRSKHITFVGHVPSEVTAWEASDSGQKSIEHLEFISHACLQRFSAYPDTTGPPECGPARMSETLVRFARNHTWLDPTISMFRAYVNPTTYDAIFAGFTRLAPALRASGVRFLVGTDTDNSRIKSGDSFNDEMELLVAAGFPTAEVLRAATSNATEFLGMSDSLGTIASGRIADLVILAGNPLMDIRNVRRVDAVLRDGRFVWKRPVPN